MKNNSQLGHLKKIAATIGTKDIPVCTYPTLDDLNNTSANGQISTQKEYEEILDKTDKYINDLRSQGFNVIEVPVKTDEYNNWFNSLSDQEKNALSPKQYRATYASMKALGKTNFKVLKV